MPPEYVPVHFRSPRSVTVRVRSVETASGGRAGSGAAPHTVKDAFGATRGPLRGSLTGGTLRPLTPAHVGRPVACPPLCPPRTRTLRLHGGVRNRAVEGREQGRDFTRTDAPPQPSIRGRPAHRRAWTAVRSLVSAANSVGWRPR
jgi:hypothetical protein